MRHTLTQDAWPRSSVHANVYGTPLCDTGHEQRDTNYRAVDDRKEYEERVPARYRCEKCRARLPEERVAGAGRPKDGQVPEAEKVPTPTGARVDSERPFA